MGPDCGTAIIGGVGIGFANVVRRGTIGVIGVAGTGLQEFTKKTAWKPLASAMWRKRRA